MINLNALPFPDEEVDQNLHFRGTIHTDGVGVTILKKRCVTQGCYSLRFIVTRESTRYINSLLLANHQELEGFYKVVDPGRREIYSTLFMKIPLFKRRWSTDTQSHSKTSLASQENTAIFFKASSLITLL